MKKDLTFDNVTVPVREQVRLSTLNLLHNPEMLEDRVIYFADRVNKSNPDILCLQEVIFESGTDSLTLKKVESATNLKQIISLQQHENNHGTLSGIAIMSSMTPIESHAFHMGVDTKLPYAIYGVFEHGSNVVIAITAHLHWGGAGEAQRLRQMMGINKKAEELKEKYSDQNPVILLSGDFNADPDGDSIRYLGGKAIDFNEECTFWTDAWVTCGNKDNEYTMLPSNHWAKETALKQNIFIPSLMQKRRIDYVFSYGWSFGKNSSPLTFHRDYDTLSQYGYPISDHAGITVDYWAKQD